MSYKTKSPYVFISSAVFQKKKMISCRGRSDGDDDDDDDDDGSKIAPAA